MDIVMIQRKKISLIATAILAVLFILAISSRVNAQVKEAGFKKLGKGITFMAKDSSASMKMNVRMQALLDVGIDDDATQDHKVQPNFMIRRYRLKFAGFAYDPRLRYKMELGISNRDQGNGANSVFNSESSNIVLDAVIKYQFHKHWDFWFGQTKLPGNRERVVSSANLQFVDRSLVNSYFNLDRDRGVWLHGEYALGNFIIRPKAAVSSGDGRNITADNLGGLGYTGRLELLPLGKFEGKKADYVLSDLDRQSSPKIAIGLTYDQNNGAVRQGGQLKSFVYKTAEDEEGNTTLVLVQNTLKSFQADMIFKYNGISALFEYADRKGASEKQENWTSGYRTGSGFNAQAGYLFKNNFEISGRYTTVTPDYSESKVIGQEEYTLAFSKYIVGHKLKIQSDVSMFNYELEKDQDAIGEEDYRVRFQVELQL